MPRTPGKTTGLGKTPGAGKATTPTAFAAPAGAPDEDQDSAASTPTLSATERPSGSDLRSGASTGGGGGADADALDDLTAALTTTRTPYLLGAALLGPALAVAAHAFTRSDLTTEAGAVALGVAALLACHWRASGGGWTGARPYLLWAVVCLGAAVLLDRIAVAIVFAVLATAGAITAELLTRRARRRARKLAWLGVGLKGALRDPRPLTDTLRHPRRGRPDHQGLPVDWMLPSHLTLDDKAQARLRSVIEKRVTVPVAVDFTDPSRVSIRRVGTTPGAIAATPDTPPDIVRAEGVLTGFLPGVKITSWQREDQSTPEAGDVPGGTPSAALALSKGHPAPAVSTSTGKLTSLTFEWPPTSAARASSTAYRARVSAALSTILGGVWEASWRPAEDTCTLTRSAPLPTFAPHPPRSDDLPRTVVAFGVRRGGALAVWDLDDQQPHILIGGSTRGGKTSFLRTLIVQLGLLGVEMDLIDGKIAGLRGLEALPAVRAKYSVAQIEHLIAAIERFFDEMMRRYERINAGDVARSGLPRRVLLIDEARFLYDRLSEHWTTVERPQLKAEADAAKKAKETPIGVPTGNEHPVLGKLRQILALAGEANMNVIFATQQAAGEWLGTEARSNFGVRVSLGNPDEESGRMLFNKNAPRRLLDNVKGRAWVSFAGTRPEEVHMWWTPQPTSADLAPARGDRPSDRSILEALGVPIRELPHLDAATDAALADDEGAPSHTTNPASALAAAGATPPQAVGSEVGRPQPSREVPTLDTARGVDGLDQNAEDAEDADLDDQDDLDDLDNQDAGEVWDPTATEQVRVIDLTDGDTLLITDDGHDLLVTVEAVEPDDVDPDVLAVSWSSPTGQPGVLGGLDEGDLLTRVMR